jgi:hypothetical protein
MVQLLFEHDLLRTCAVFGAIPVNGIVGHLGDLAERPPRITAPRLEPAHRALESVGVLRNPIAPCPAGRGCLLLRKNYLRAVNQLMVPICHHQNVK